MARKKQRQPISGPRVGTGAPLVSSLAITGRDERLWLALEERNLPKAAALLRDGANPEAVHPSGVPSLLFLVDEQCEDPRFYDVLLSAGATLRARDSRGNTALHRAVSQGAGQDVVRILLERGADTASLNDAGETPLHLAARVDGWHALEVVRLLLRNGSDPRRADNQGHLPLHVAASPEVKSLLLPISGLEEATREDLELIQAVSDENTERVRSLCAAGARPTVRDSSERFHGGQRHRNISALHLAVKNAPRPLVELLTAQPCLDLDVADVEGETPLHFLLRYRRGRDRYELAHLLLEAGADVNAANDRGETPLFTLFGHREHGGEIELFELLLSHGAQLDRADHSGTSVLDWAVREAPGLATMADPEGFLRAVRLLVDRKSPTRREAPRADGLPLEAWLEQKETQYYCRPVRRVARSLPPQTRFRAIFSTRPHAAEQPQVRLWLEGAEQSVTLFDWYQLKDEEERDEHTRASQVWAFQVEPGEAERRMEREEWIPFGAVGLSGEAGDLAEIPPGGTLFLDLTEGSNNDAPVWLVNRGEARRLNDSFRALMSRLVEGPVAAQR